MMPFSRSFGRSPSRGILSCQLVGTRFVPRRVLGVGCGDKGRSTLAPIARCHTRNGGNKRHLQINQVGCDFLISLAVFAAARRDTPFAAGSIDFSNFDIVRVWSSLFAGASRRTADSLTQSRNVVCFWSQVQFGTWFGSGRGSVRLQASAVGSAVWLRPNY